MLFKIKRLYIFKNYNLHIDPHRLPYVLLATAELIWHTGEKNELVSLWSITRTGTALPWEEEGEWWTVDTEGSRVRQTVSKHWQRCQKGRPVNTKTYAIIT